MKDLPRYIDIGFCMVVLPVMVMMFPIERWYHHFPVYMLSLTGWLYTLYILNRAVTVPWLFKRSRRRAGALGLMAVSVAVTYAFFAVRLYTPRHQNSYDVGVVWLFPKVEEYQEAVWCLFMIVEAFSFAVGLLVEMERLRTRRREVEAQRDRAELDLYRAQIKPHFMFNTLNSLYGLFLTGSDKALPSLERFIDMMRYMHTLACRQSVRLCDEVEYIRRYVELQSLRLNEKTRLDLHIDIANPELQIPPMLLVTFVENCFKHGVSPVEDCTIHISIDESHGLLRLYTRNTIFPARRIGEHMGIANCRRRLQLSYPDAHTLSIARMDRTFTVELKMNLSA